MPVVSERGGGVNLLGLDFDTYNFNVPLKTPTTISCGQIVSDTHSKKGYPILRQIYNINVQGSIFF